MNLPSKDVENTNPEDSDSMSSSSGETSSESDSGSSPVARSRHSPMRVPGVNSTNANDLSQVDWDKLSSSPIRSFQPISQQGNSIINYNNQFKKTDLNPKRFQQAGKRKRKTKRSKPRKKRKTNSKGTKSKKVK